VETPTYKVVELSTVTDDTLETTLNEWSAQGWLIQSIDYVTSPSSRRPVMAFLFFIRRASDQEVS
jgi:hypothetical protein